MVSGQASDRIGNAMPDLGNVSALLDYASGDIGTSCWRSLKPR
jgi:hypothetical protein